MKGKLRILHTSDLLVGSPYVSLEELGAYIEQAVEIYNLKNSIDYLIVSGNITYNGSTQSFSLATDFLKTITSFILRKSGRSVNLSRLIIVPGKNDIQGDALFDRDFNNYKEFYNKLFYSEIKSGVVTSFKHNVACVRELKDLTSIGICCLQHSGSLEMDGLLEKRIEAIHWAANSQISTLEYSRKTPTLLVTSDSPLLAWHPSQLYDSTLHEVLNESLNVSLNLFGSGSASCFLPEPFICTYGSIGTGLRLDERLWPFIINLIEIEKKHSEDQPDLLEKYQIEAFRMQKSKKIVPWKNNGPDNFKSLTVECGFQPP